MRATSSNQLRRRVFTDRDEPQALWGVMYGGPGASIKRQVGAITWTSLHGAAVARLEAFSLVAHSGSQPLNAKPRMEGR